VSFAIAFAATAAARAQDDAGCPDSGIGKEDACDHFELTMGFVAGARRFDKESFAMSGGGGEIDGAGSLVEPFQNPPFDNVPVFGLRYDLRLVVSYVRMTVGVDFPFAYFQPGQTRGIYDVGGIERDVVVRKIRPYELRFGIGGEYPIGRIAPFVDLIGEVDWTKTELAIDGDKVAYDATSFGFSARAGMRVYLREWFFISVAGEYGIVGNRFWGAELSLGFAFG
jgi:hypothetical protein